MCASNARTLLLIGSLPSSSWLFKKNSFWLDLISLEHFISFLFVDQSVSTFHDCIANAFCQKVKKKRFLTKTIMKICQWNEHKLKWPVCLFAYVHCDQMETVCVTVQPVSRVLLLVRQPAAEEKKRRRSETLWKVSTVTTVCAFYVVVLGLWSFCLQFYRSQKTVLLLASVLESAFWTPILHPLLATHSRGGPQGKMHADTSARP